MTITVEDGTGVDGANSYITTAEFAAYATARGNFVPADEAEREINLIKAMDYLEALDPRYIGVRVFPNILSWPRTIDETTSPWYDDDEIPSSLKQAQAALATAAMKGIELMPSTAGTTVGGKKKVKAGSVEIEYADALSSSSGMPSIPTANALLLPLLGRGSGMGQMRVVRG